MADQPFVAEPPGDAVVVAGLAARAAAEWHLPTPELIRSSMTAVFAAGEDVVLRVCRPTAPPQVALALARLLTDHGLRVPRPARDDVVLAGPLAVLAFERLHSSGSPVDWSTVGQMIATVHAIDPSRLPVDLPLPRGLDFPWWRLDAVLDDLTAVVDEVAVTAMRACLDRHRPALTAARRRAGVVCHGDVHSGNVLQTTDGPALLDWDLLCREPIGWDHAALRTWATRWGGDRGASEAFAAGAGELLDDDPFTNAVAELRLVAATLMRVRAAQREPSAADEAEQRLRWWRGDPDAPMWRAV